MSPRAHAGHYVALAEVAEPALLSPDEAAAALYGAQEAAATAGVVYGADVDRLAGAARGSRSGRYPDTMPRPWQARGGPPA